MKILVLGSRVPYPLRDGGAIATYNMLWEMASQGTELTFFTFNTRKHFNSDREISDAFPFCRVIPNYLDADVRWHKALFYFLTAKNYNMVRFDDKKSKEKLKELLQTEKFDIIHFEGLYTWPWMATVKDNSSAFLSLRQHNVEHIIWEKLALRTGFLRRLYLRKLAAGLRETEIQALRSVDVVLPISESDMQSMKALVPEAQYYYYPGGVFLRDSAVVTPNNPLSISHIGSMEWLPNREAVSWFIENIWPKVLREFPSANFHLAGKALKTSDTQFKAPGVINHGEVPDAVRFQNEHAIAVVPLAAGSGLRMKTLESMALGKPVISTVIGAEGIPYTDRENILIARNEEDWINDISMLFSDALLAQKIGENARKLVQQEFSVRIHTRKLLQFYSQQINKNGNRDKEDSP